MKTQITYQQTWDTNESEEYLGDRLIAYVDGDEVELGEGVTVVVAGKSLNGDGFYTSRVKGNPRKGKPGFVKLLVAAGTVIEIDGTSSVTLTSNLHGRVSS